MDKNGGDKGAGKRSAKSSDPAMGMQDVFSHSIFGSALPGSFNPLGPMHGAFAMMGRTPAYGLPPTSAAGGSAGAFGGLGSLTANQAATLGLTSASEYGAAWWSMASQLAAQEYLARLQQATASGLNFSGLEAMQSFDPLAQALNSNKTSSKSKNHNKPVSSSKASSSATSTSSPTDPLAVSTAASFMNNSALERRLPADTEVFKYTSSIVGPKIPGTTKRGRKKTISLDPPSVTLTPASIRDSWSKLGLTPTKPKSSTSSSEVSQQDLQKSLGDLKLPPGLTIRAAHADMESAEKPTNGNLTPSVTVMSCSSEDAPLNLSMKTAESEEVGLNLSKKHLDEHIRWKHLDSDLGERLKGHTLQGRIAMKMQAQQDREVAEALLLEDQVKTQIMELTKKRKLQAQAAREAAAAENSEAHGNQRPRNLGRGTSKPKKNTVASLLAQSRAMGIKPDLAQLQALEEHSKNSSSDSSSSTPAPAHQISLLKPNTFQQKSESGTSEGSKISSAVSITPVPRKTDSAQTTPHAGEEDGEGLTSGGEDSLMTTTSDTSDSQSCSEVDGDMAASRGVKRDAGGSGKEAPQEKKKRKIVDYEILRLPLEHGWKRETYVRTYSQSGIRGEVVYTAPCGKRFRQYPDVIRYLEKNSIQVLSRVNFSFSSKVHIGEYLEPTSGEVASEEDRYIRFSEEMMQSRLESIRKTKGWPRIRGEGRTRKRNSRRQRLPTSTTATSSSSGVNLIVPNPSLQVTALTAPLAAEQMAQLAEQYRLQQKLEQEQAVLAIREAQRYEKEETRRRKQHLRFLKEQERQEKQEAARRERELKAQQLHEARRRRQEELEKKKQEEHMRKVQEREAKRQQALLLKEQERERRRQHMMLVRALESRKRQEEREKKKEEIRAEKRAIKERRMEKRIMDLEIIRELKKPTEDLELTDQKPLPKLDRLLGLQLAGKAFANVLMVFEFLHNFGETLGFDMESLPSLDSLQRALLNNEEAEEELLSVMSHLLVCAIEDPGIPNPARHTTILGQSLKQADITHTFVY